MLLQLLLHVATRLAPPNGLQHGHSDPEAEQRSSVLVRWWGADGSIRCAGHVGRHRQECRFPDGACRVGGSLPGNGRLYSGLAAWHHGAMPAVGPARRSPAQVDAGAGAVPGSCCRSCTGIPKTRSSSPSAPTMPSRCGARADMALAWHGMARHGMARHGLAWHGNRALQDCLRSTCGADCAHGMALALHSVPGLRASHAGGSPPSVGVCTSS